MLATRRSHSRTSVQRTHTEIGMITTRDLLRMGALLTAGTLLACANDTTSPGSPPPVGPPPVSPPPVSPPPAGPVTGNRVLTFLDIDVPRYPMVPVEYLDRGQIGVLARDQRGELMVADGGSFSISSDNPSVATVGNTQLSTWPNSGISAELRAITPGEAVVSVSWTIGGVTKTATTTIEVHSLKGWSLKIFPAASTVKLGHMTGVEAVMVDATGAYRFAPPSVFTLDRNDVVGLRENEASCWEWYTCGSILVHGVAVGEATLTARWEGFSAAIKVTVVP